MSNLTIRIQSAIILAVLLTTIVFLGNTFVYISVLCTAIQASAEWYKLAYKNIPIKNLIFIVFLQSFLLFLFEHIEIPIEIYMKTILCFALIILFFKRFIYKNISLVNCLGFLSVNLLACSIMFLYEHEQKQLLIWVISVVCTGDIGGYTIGRLFKGPKLCKKISPNKTWSGLVGVVLFGCTISGILCVYSITPIPSFIWTNNEYLFDRLYQTILLGGLTGILGQAGDLLESWCKRKAGVKDSGNLIPGHGGILDRLDSFLFTIPFVVFINQVFS